MKIIMVTNNTLEDKVGGHERYVRDLASTLVTQGHHVTIVAKRRSPQSPARETCGDGVVLERYRVPSKRNPWFAPLYPLYVATSVARRTRRRGDRVVVHAHMGLPALPLALERARYVFTFHSPVWREFVSERQGSYALPTAVESTAVRSLKAAESLVARRATVTVVLSEFMRSELGLLDAGAKQRAELVPGGISEHRFTLGDAELAGERDDPPVLFTARRLVPRAGIDQLIRAMGIIAGKLPNAQLKIAGAGGQELALKQLAQDLGLTRQVEFLGRISDIDLISWYRRASLVVMPTRELEGFGLTTAEALACGAAVVGTPVGGTPELLRPLDPTLVASGTSGEAIASAVLDVLADSRRLMDIRSRARASVVPNMGWGAVAARYLDLYSRVA